jgi:hypothetical protein
MIAAMLQDLAGASDAEIVASYQAAMRSINERHRTMWPPHPHERYLDEETLAPLLETRGAKVLDFVRELNTHEFLLSNGVTEPELEAVLAALGARVAL